MRILNLHNETSSHDIEDRELSQISIGTNLFSNCPILESVKDKISPYAYHFTILNLAGAMNWKISHSPAGFSVFKAKKEEEILVNKLNSSTLKYSYYFSVSMGMPCEHLLACLIHSMDSSKSQLYL